MYLLGRRQAVCHLCSSGGRDSNFVPPLAQEQATRFESDRLIQFRDIVLDGEAVGTIYIESDLQRLDTRLREYTIAFLATSFPCSQARELRSSCLGK